MGIAGEEFEAAKDIEHQMIAKMLHMNMSKSEIIKEIKNLPQYPIS